VRVEAGRVAPPLELAPGRVYRLGGSTPLDGGVTWAPAIAFAHHPINAYLLLEGHRALLVDTGVAAHEAEVLGQLRELIGPGGRVTVFLTRSTMDCVSNLAAIAREFEIERVVTGGGSNPFDAFDDANLLRQTTRRDVIQQPGGELSRSPQVEVAPGRRLRVLAPSLRLLPTFWVEDRATGLLFTSDFFTHGVARSADSPALIGPGGFDDVTREAVAAHLFSKFDWLRLADTTEIREDLERTFREVDPAMVAPTYGCAIAGRERIRRHLGLILSVLSEAPW
jgi:hypothetical protein